MNFEKSIKFRRFLNWSWTSGQYVNEFKPKKFSVCCPLNIDRQSSFVCFSEELKKIEYQRVVCALNWTLHQIIYSLTVVFLLSTIAFDPDFINLLIVKYSKCANDINAQEKRGIQCHSKRFPMKWLNYVWNMTSHKWCRFFLDAKLNMVLNQFHDFFFRYFRR